MAKSREIVFYHEQHTLMTQDVTVLINEKVLKEMLIEDLTDEVKRELIQTFYVALLKSKLHIAGKHSYGDWNAHIGDISEVYQYLGKIIDKVKGNVTIEEIDKQFVLINDRILALSEEEKANSISIQAEVYEAFI